MLIAFFSNHGGQVRVTSALPNLGTLVLYLRDLVSFIITLTSRS